MNLKKRVIFSIIPGLFLLLACSGPEKKIEKKPTEAEILQAFQIPESSYDELPKERKLFAAHYPISNEMRIDLFMKPIENIGGGYIGVGTDQNLSFIAKARSEFAYLMDFDPVIVRVNKIHILFLKTAPTYPEFLKLWSFSNNKASYELIKKEFEAGSDFNLINQAWKIAATKVGVPSRLKDLNYMTKRFGLQSFHNVEKEYAYLHELAKKGRIQAIPGDLTGKKTMQAISL
ncbi:MAG: hypothetical protein KDK45_11585, partial [Leptospiraceae bacterium]|nr:hypothetical protein [Leptospiraceae bacterium]